MTNEIQKTSFPKAILHIDCDAFFVSCEQVMNPEYKNKVVVTGKERGIVSALSYQAKTLGIKRGMRLFEVKQICPTVIILPSDYETYSLFSKKMFSILNRFSSDVEEYGIDEGFVDVTGLQQPLNMNYVQIAKKIKETILQELDLVVSVGLATTKGLAKLASKHEKPNGFTVVENIEIKNFLKNILLQDIWGIGVNTTQYLNKLRVYTALEFVEKPFDWVLQYLTKPYQEIWQELNGKMINKVDAEKKRAYDSVSKTKTFTPPSNDKNFIFAQLVKNLENACIKIRRYDLVAKKITIFLKTQNFKVCATEAKLSRASAYPTEIITLAESLFSEIYNPQIQYRATGVIFSELQEDKNIQYSLFDKPLQIEKSKKIYQAVDKLSKRFGKHVIHLGASIQANNFLQHLGKRGELCFRQTRLLKGETKRKRLGIPMLQYLVK